MRRKFFLNLVFLLAINLLIKPIYIFGIDRSVQNVLGPEGYGIYWALFNFIYLFQVINDLGLQNFTSTFISQNRVYTNKYFGHLAILKGAASLVFLVLVSFGAYVIGYMNWSLMIPLMLSQILVSMVFFLRSSIAGLGFYKTDSMLSVLDKLVMIFLVGWLLWGNSSLEFSINIFVLAQLVSIFITFSIAFIIVWSKIGRLTFKWNPKLLMALLRKSAPFAVVFILTTLFTRIDSVMVERMLPDGAFQAGIYAAGYRLLEASNMFAYLFAGLLLPMFAHIYRDKEESKKLLSTALSLMWVIVITISLLSVYYKQEIMDLLYTHTDQRWYSVLSLLMMSYIPMGLSYIAGALLLANDKVKKLNIIYGIAVVVNVILNAILIMRNGAVGAAQATLFTQLAATIMVYYYVFSEVQITPTKRSIMKMIYYGGIVVGLLLLNYWLALNIKWEVQFVGLGLLFVGIALLMKMIPIDLISKRDL